MKLHKIVMSALLSSVMLLTSCAPAVVDAARTDTNPQSADSTSSPDSSVTSVEALKTTVTETSATEPDNNTVTPPESLKILAIGNSFSTDCMQYLWQIANNTGVKSIVLGNLYYGGCSLEQHLSFAKADSSPYTYYKNTSGAWQSTPNAKMSAAIADEDWDYITLQQTSKTCGLRFSYGETLTSLVDYVRSKNTTAKLVWNMTWAYQQDSTHSSFPNYDKSQRKMYDMIIDCTKNCIEPEKRFSFIIPCMTSIQNARTSFLGDTLTRDGYHLDNYIGRYIAGLTWYAAITGASVDSITYNPSVDMINEGMLDVAREAVKCAMEKPYEITQSELTTGKRPDDVTSAVDPSVVLNPSDFIEADTAVADANGIDLAGYKLLTWDYFENTYWNCTSKAGTTVPGESAGTYKQNVCSKKKFSLDELPAGTLFICDSGWQFRLEIYESENEKYTGSRPSMITERFFVLSKEFLGNAKFVAWNISTNPKTDISAIYAQAACRLRIYIPNK